MSEGAPQFTGIATYQDPSGRFSFKYPWDWSAETLDEDREGIMFKPESDDPDTYFAAWPSQLDITITADDLADLDQSFDTGLRSLPDLTVLTSTHDTFGNIIRLERLITYTHNQNNCQRRVWAIYADQMQLILTYQASSPDRYKYWLPMGNYCYATLELPEATWFATDPSTQASQ